MTDSQYNFIWEIRKHLEEKTYHTLSPEDVTTFLRIICDELIRNNQE